MINIALGSSEKLCKALQCFLGGYIPYQHQKTLQSFEVLDIYTVATGKKKPQLNGARGELKGFNLCNLAYTRNKHWCTLDWANGHLLHDNEQHHLLDM